MQISIQNYRNKLKEKQQHETIEEQQSSKLRLCTHFKCQLLFNQLYFFLMEDAQNAFLAHTQMNMNVKGHL